MLASSCKTAIGCSSRCSLMDCLIPNASTKAIHIAPVHLHKCKCFHSALSCAVCHSGWCPDWHHFSWMLHSEHVAATSLNACSSIVATPIISISLPNAALTCAARCDGLVAGCSSAMDCTLGMFAALLRGWRGACLAIQNARCKPPHAVCWSLESSSTRQRET